MITEGDIDQYQHDIDQYQHSSLNDQENDHDLRCLTQYL